VDSPQIIYKYFPGLSETQQKQMEMLGELYAEWNSKINVISRKDIDNFYERHVLHSLGIAKVISFKPNTRILDVGTGGGFPGGFPGGQPGAGSAGAGGVQVARSASVKAHRGSRARAWRSISGDESSP